MWKCVRSHRGSAWTAISMKLMVNIKPNISHRSGGYAMLCTDWLMCGKFLIPSLEMVSNNNIFEFRLKFSTFRFITITYFCLKERKDCSFCCTVLFFFLWFFHPAHKICWYASFVLHRDPLHFSVEIFIEKNMSDVNSFHLYIDIQMSSAICRVNSFFFVCLVFICSYLSELSAASSILMGVLLLQWSTVSFTLFWSVRG